MHENVKTLLDGWSFDSPQQSEASLDSKNMPEVIYCASSVDHGPISKSVITNLQKHGVAPFGCLAL